MVGADRSKLIAQRLIEEWVDSLKAKNWGEVSSSKSLLHSLGLLWRNRKRFDLIEVQEMNCKLWGTNSWLTSNRGFQSVREPLRNTVHKNGSI